MQGKPIPLRKRIFYTLPQTDDSRMRAVLNHAILHLHPTTVPVPALRFTSTWGLGGISTVLALLLGLTGLLLMLGYQANVGSAYQSIQILEAQVVSGALIRSVHHGFVNLLVVTTFLHLFRAFAPGRQGQIACDTCHPTGVEGEGGLIWQGMLQRMRKQSSQTS